MPFGNLLVENETDKECDKREQMASQAKHKKMVWEQAMEHQCDSVSGGLISMKSNYILYMTCWLHNHSKLCIATKTCLRGIDLRMKNGVVFKILCVCKQQALYTDIPAVVPRCPHTSPLPHFQRMSQHHTPPLVGRASRWPFQCFCAPDCLQGDRFVNELLVVYVSAQSQDLPVSDTSTVRTAWVVFVANQLYTIAHLLPLRLNPLVQIMEFSCT